MHCRFSFAGELRHVSPVTVFVQHGLIRCMGKCQRRPWCVGIKIGVVTHRVAREKSYATKDHIDLHKQNGFISDSGLAHIV